MIRVFFLAALGALAGAMPAQAASVVKSYSYFSIGGKTLSEIETELAKRGPKMQTTGNRHPGATRMEFTSRVGYEEADGWCRVAKATVTVKANMILPRWRQRRAADADTRLIWDTLSSDIKRHEESHVIIAKNHARELEDSLKALRRTRSCEAAQEQVQAVTQRVLAKHDREQDRFDRIEGINFESRMLRLLQYRLERM
jgi:predicted secreted Zn-dependent protease